MRYVELRRHTDNEGDRLTPQGPADAEMTGRGGLHPPYAAFVSTGAARATQMPGILRHAAGQDDTPITAAPGLRSPVENRWRDAARAAGKRADLQDIRAIDPDLVERESWLLGSALRQVVAELPEGGRAGLPPLLLGLTCLAPSVDVRGRPLASVAVVTQLVTHLPRVRRSPRRRSNGGGHGLCSLRGHPGPGGPVSRWSGSPGQP